MSGDQDGDRRLFDLEYRRSSALPTPAEGAEIRAYDRCKAQISRIRDEEWARGQGFPYYPRWVIPTIMIVGFAIAIVAGVGLVASRPAVTTVPVMQP
jgi:hypothetical protein